MEPIIFSIFCENNTPLVASSITAILQEENSNILDIQSSCTKIVNVKYGVEGSLVEDFYEKIVPNFTEQEFQEHFRMCKKTMERFINYLQSKYIETVEDMSSCLPLNKKIAITVWNLANKNSYREVANLFGIHKSTVSYVFHEICNLISLCKVDWIKWPNNENVQVIKQATQFPNVVGFIDGCHIQIKAPRRNSVDFYNRKETHSIILQGVCDHNLKFVDIYIGQTGRAHDARVFRPSPLANQIERLIDPNDHILGDSAYTLSLRLMTPYRDNGHLTEEQNQYNMIHAQSRSCIERAFGRLKSKFRRLNYLELVKIRDGPNIICAACVLHNFILNYEPIENNNYYEDNIILLPHNAVEKRNAICTILSAE